MIQASSDCAPLEPLEISATARVVGRLASKKQVRAYAEGLGTPRPRQIDAGT